MSTYVYNVDYTKMKEREKAGVTKDLLNFIRDKVDIDETELMRVMPEILASIGVEKRRMVIYEYYFRHQSIMFIKWNYGFHDYIRVEKMLDVGRNEIVKQLLKIYEPRKFNCTIVNDEDYDILL